MLQKSETNNATVTRLCNVRPHPNADRIKLATVLGTQVIVGLDAKDGDLVIYFDSNLRLSPEYLYWNSLYAKSELNCNKTQKGYFGNNGRVKAQKFRGEISNGLAMPLSSLALVADISKVQPFHEVLANLRGGDEFTHINGVKICEKYVIPPEVYSKRGPTYDSIDVGSFWKHWETKQLMREKEKIAPGILYVEEKIHGTSGRTGVILCFTRKKWWQFWKPKSKWKVISGTRRINRIRGHHLAFVRNEIQEKVAPHLHKGEQIYYEIFGYDSETGKPIQTGFTYGCSPRQYRVMLYRVTITTPDGFCIDLNREQVYKRAEELGLEKPILLGSGGLFDCEGKITEEFLQTACNLAKGKSALDANTMREGIVVWFKDVYGKWDCLKHKSEEFLIKESELMDKEIGDPEDNL